jgi:HSP20 family protein
VSEDSITASYADGVLEIHVPKPEQAKPKKIEIGVDAAPAVVGSAPEAG